MQRRHSPTRKPHRRYYRVLAVIIALAAISVLLIPAIRLYPLIPLHNWLRHPLATWQLAHGENPHPMELRRPPVAPLSAMARLGRQIFLDPSLSGSGRMSCASCHSPEHAYGPPGKRPVMLGGPNMHTPGYRAVPSLMYLERQPSFSIGPDNEVSENSNIKQRIVKSTHATRARKTARDTATSAANLVPQGGLFWDGRVNTLQQQAGGPMFNTFEMDGGTPARVAAKLSEAPYANTFRKLFGTHIFRDPHMAVSEALFAIARYQIEDRSFHPYSSKYDAWLEGKARFNAAQLRGYLLFNDPKKGDCAACHLDTPTRDDMPPLFTDHQYEALGVPRNPAIPANRNPHYFDLGICGPFRKDLKKQTQYCGMFLTPTLRNVATRHVFFHNGVYHTLKQVLAFYDFRDTEPQKIYPHGSNGKTLKYNDLPARYRTNVDTVDPPLNRHRGQQPAMTQQDMRDIIAFLKTLTDGYYVPSDSQSTKTPASAKR